jgi:large subunit ribosomal protein L31
MKKGIHPEYHQAKVICNGEELYTVGSTKPELRVEVWSGNHPFYTGQQKSTAARGRIDQFNKKYGITAE